MDYKAICHDVIDIAIEAGDFIREERKLFTVQSIETKGLHNFVSYVDKKAEAEIVHKLSRLLPESGFIAEEGTSNRKGERYNWIIDPLDGTTNFIHGLPPYAVSIALMEGQEIVVGVVHEVCLRESFYAWKEGPAMLNQEIITVSKAPTIKDSLVATGFPYYDYHRMQSYMQILEHLMRNSHGIRRIGSAATDLAYVACGRFDAFYEYSLSPWDVAAGCFILQQAGGKNTDFTGGDNYIFGKELVSTNGLIHEELMHLVQEYMLKTT